LAYLPDPIDALWACSGALWQGGGGSDALWFFKFGTNQWERKADFPGNPGASYWQTTAYDSARGLMIAEGMYETCEYNPQNSTWTPRYQKGGGWWNAYRRSEIDPVRRVMVILGSGSGASCHLYNLDTYAHRDITHACVGDTEIMSAAAPGLSYDSKTGEMVAWNGGTSVYKLDIDAKRWSKVAAAATNTADPGPATQAQGIYSKWRYIPSRDVFFIVADRIKNVFLYKSGSGTSVETKSHSSLGPARILVSPNPVTGRAVVRYAGATLKPPIQICAPDGRRIVELASGSTWDTKGLPAGIYLAKTKTGTLGLSRRIIVIK
jgi:hypothetical protein